MNKASPKPQKKVSVKTMDFPEAIKQIILKKKVTRLEWKDKNIYGFLNGDLLSIHTEDGKNQQWIINDGDMLGTDWILA